MLVVSEQGIALNIKRSNGFSFLTSICTPTFCIITDDQLLQVFLILFLAVCICDWTGVGGPPRRQPVFSSVNFISRSGEILPHSPEYIALMSI